MKYNCTHCGLTSPDGNLWCQRKECSANHITEIMQRGDRLGDIRITNLLRVTRTASIYEAERDEQKILLKVAHHDTEEDREHNVGFARYLKDEAKIFAEIASKNKQYPQLPKLLPPFIQTTIEKRPYGEIVFRDKLRTYTVFEHIQGEFLRDMLNTNPQPQIEHIGWIMVSLCATMLMLQDELGLYHLSLSPDVVMIRYDLEKIPRPILFDLGLAQRLDGKNRAMMLDAMRREWLVRYVHPAYIAPELLDGAYNESTDAYGLGLVFYEMLAGRSAYEYKTRGENAVITAVKQSRREPLNRSDIPALAQVADRTVTNPSVRNYRNVTEFVKELMKFFGQVPPERTRPKRWYNNPNVRLVGLVAALAISGTLIFLGLLSLLGGSA